jgi:serine/threonine protein kinase/Tfp pilus assembly protein PilF
MIGKTISHYKIIEKLGSGGMGVVYKARDLNLDRFVALKFLPPHIGTDNEEKQRFIHEAKAASALDHHNICTIHEIDLTEEGQLFICMAYYKGETLKNKIERGKLLNLEEVIDFALQLADGLNRAHELKIVHRDLKAANIVITERGEVKILDFGLAKLSGQTKLTKENSTLGTVEYMSPEQAQGKPVDHRTDIWSLGIVLYEMLTGKTPFKRDYESAIIYSIFNETQEPVSALRAGVSLELERIVNKCLAKKPTDRYQHADELSVDLRQLKFDAEKDFSKLQSTISIKAERNIPKYIIYSLIFIFVIILTIVGYLLPERGKDIEKSAIETLIKTEWENSIAVLPFVDLSPNKDQDYFCAGMTEQIITNLTKLNKLKVTARTSVMQYINTTKSIPEIGGELRVKNILEGSVSKYGNRIRVIAQLVNSEDGSHIWAENYDRNFEDLFAIYDDVSKSIADMLLLKLAENEVAQIQTERPDNINAYEFYLKGKHFYNKFFWGQLLETDFKNSEKMYKEAIVLDDKYTLAYTGLTELYHIYEYYRTRTYEERQYYLDLQEKYINIAFNLDPNSAEVNRVINWIYENKGEIDKAFTCIKKALKTNPNDAECNRSYGVFLRMRGLYNQSITYFNKALELDPICTMSYISRALTYMEIGKWNEAEKDFKEALIIDPTSYFALCNTGRLLIFQNKSDEAEKSLNKVYEKSAPFYNFCRVLLYASRGENEKAFDNLRGMEIQRDGYLIIYHLLNMHEEFFRTLEKTTEIDIKNLKSRYLSLENSALFANYKGDSRFQKILAKHKKMYEENIKKYAGF